MSRMTRGLALKCAHLLDIVRCERRQASVAHRVLRYGVFAGVVFVLPAGRIDVRRVWRCFSMRPAVEPFSDPASLREGQRASVISGDLPINISWTKDGEPISESNTAGTLVNTVSGFPSTLLFKCAAARISRQLHLRRPDGHPRKVARQDDQPEHVGHGIVPGLNPAMTYHFRVFAENRLARSDASHSAKVTTAEEVGGGAIYALKRSYFLLSN
ncbi:hypothetical protein MTO96_002507 [Rhipicephalus appendiculatus]